MTDLAIAALVVGALLALLGGIALAAPDRARRGARAFPRSAWTGRLLTAIDIAWVAVIVVRAPLGRFEHLKPLVYIAAPAGYLLIVSFMDELLAPRALGGLLLLAANPLVRSAFVHPSSLRLVMTCFAYFWVVAGMVLMLSPYRFRQAAELTLGSDSKCRVTGAIRLLLGTIMICLALFVYRS